MYIAIYGRVSTEKQLVDGFGLDVQLTELIAEAKENKLEYREYIDQGISGTSITRRLGLQTMLEDVSKGIITEVWVTKLSRLGRNTRDVLNIIHELEKNNVIFKSKRDGIDTSNQMGKIMLQFMSIVSEMERDIIIETTRTGADYRASLGKIYGCPPILGYNRIGHGKNSYIVINDIEAKIVKQIYKQYLNGSGYKAIVNNLNQKGLRTKKGHLFSIGTIKAILVNPLYVGMIRYNLYKDWEKKRRKGRQNDDDIILVEGLHDRIISKAKWDKVQKKLKELRGLRRPVNDTYLLNVILKCPQWGSSMTGTTRRYKTKTGVKTIRIYICGLYQNKGKCACNINSTRADHVEELVVNHVQNILESNFHRDTKGYHGLENMDKILVSNDRMKKKILLRNLVKSIVSDEKKTGIKMIIFKVNEELLSFIKVKYTDQYAKHLLNIINAEINNKS